MEPRPCEVNIVAFVLQRGTPGPLAKATLQAGLGWDELRSFPGTQTLFPGGLVPGPGEAEPGPQPPHSPRLPLSPALPASLGADSAFTALWGGGPALANKPPVQKRKP